MSKHHYAIELSKKHQVYFLNYANADPNVKEVSIQETKYENLKVLNYPNSFKGLRMYPSFVRRNIYKKQAQKIQAVLPPLSIVWSFDGHRFEDLKVFEADYYVFHPVDYLNSNLEQAIAQSADIVFASTEGIAQRYKSSNELCFKINHGLNEVFLNPPKEISLEGKNQLRAAMVGNICQKYLSQKTLFTTTSQNPQVDFYFIGPQSSEQAMTPENKNYFDKMTQLDNVYRLGTKHFEVLKDYLAAMDVLLICYDLSSLPQTPSPHKVLEYLSSGKIIVSTFLDDYKDQPDLLNMANTLEQYPDLFKKTIANLAQYNDSSLMEKRRNFAQSFTYSKQVKKALDLINKYRDKR